MRLFFKLRRSVQLLCIAMLGCSSILGILLMWQYRDHAVEASTSARDLSRFIQVVKALNTISAERGPTNAIVAEDGDRPDLAARLAASRQRSDAALARIADDASLAIGVGTIRDNLREARSSIDAIVARPKDERTIADVDKAVAVMVAVIDRADPLVEASTRPLTSKPLTPITGYAVLIRAVSDMRDYAGRMGSALMVPLALKRPMTAEQRAVYDSAEGRVMELYRLVGGTVRMGGDAATRAALSDVEAGFFGGGMSLFHAVLDAGRDGTYPMNRETFTASVQPSFHTLETLRDAVAGRAWGMIEAEGRQARWSFAIVGAVTLVMIGLECTLILAAQRLVFRPLLDAREAILGLVAGQVDDLPERPRAFGEMGELFGALTLLKGQLRDRDALDRENTQLTEQLRDLADRDGLTGVLNRGALERIVADMIDDDAGPDTLGLILFDIDHFKAINDGFGHSAGDCVLRMLAARWQELVPGNAVFARYGGEEFAAIVPNGAMPRLLGLAERFRKAAALPVYLPSGALVPVTASFGVAATARGFDTWAHLVEAADAALYNAKRSGRNAVRGDTDPDTAPDTAAAA